MRGVGCEYTDETRRRGKYAEHVKYLEKCAIFLSLKYNAGSEFKVAANVYIEGK